MSKLNKIWLSPPHMSGEEQQYIKEAFDTNWVAPTGPHIEGFEQAIGEYCGVGHVVALSSGTAAIHLALILMGVKSGDEVIVSSFTFSGSVNPIIYQGGVPVMVDSERDTWNMDPVLLEEAIKDRVRRGKKPKAVIVVHLYGMPAQIEALQAICQQYKIPLIEDAAEALGASYRDKKLGTFGDVGIYSFNGNKIITTSGGGALVSNNESWVKKAKFLATQARDDAPHYEHSEVGFNYRLSNVLAGIGRGQMQVLDERVERRRENNQFYRDLLGGKQGITFLTAPDHSYDANYWLTTVLIDPDLAGVSRDEVMYALAESNIESRPLWKPMHLQPVFSKYPYYGKGVSDELFEKGVCLPSGTNMSTHDYERISEVFNKIFHV